MTATKTLTLREFNNANPITYLWICGVGCPAGEDFNHDTDTDDADDYCDFAELDVLNGLPGYCDCDGEPTAPGLWELTGSVDEFGLWCWDGEGEINDLQGNMIYNVKAK